VLVPFVRVWCRFEGVDVAFVSLSEVCEDSVAVERFDRVRLGDFPVEMAVKEGLLRVLRGVCVVESARFRFIVRREERSDDRRFSVTERDLSGDRAGSVVCTQLFRFPDLIYCMPF
jgi:hypothetical protein